MSSSTDAAFTELAAYKSGDAIPLFEIEGQILELWDQLNELTLEKALLEAQTAEPPGEYVPLDNKKHKLIRSYQRSNLRRTRNWIHR